MLRLIRVSINYTWRRIVTGEAAARISLRPSIHKSEHTTHVRPDELQLSKWQFSHPYNVYMET